MITVFANPIIAKLSDSLLEKVNSDKTKDDYYINKVYCCNCSPSYWFKVYIIKEIRMEDNRVICPRCKVNGYLNDFGQLWSTPHY